MSEKIRIKIPMRPNVELVDGKIFAIENIEQGEILIFKKPKEAVGWGSCYLL